MSGAWARGSVGIRNAVTGGSTANVNRQPAPAASDLPELPGGPSNASSGSSAAPLSYAAKAGSKGSPVSEGKTSKNSVDRHPLQGSAPGLADEPTYTAAGNPKLFDYYVVLDFEATCEENQRLADQEIIEFPSVLVDAETLTVVSEFQRYIRPVCRPKLSAFCTSLTGITQPQVDGAQPFPTVLNEYLSWLQQGKLGVEPPSKSFAIVTCGDWDLKTMLPLQLSLVKDKLPAGFRTPPFFQRWINLKAVYARYMTPPGARPPKGMPEMLQAVGKGLIGRHHSGIDDCRNIAVALIECLKRGHAVDFTWQGEPGCAPYKRWFGASFPPPPTSVIDAAPKAPIPFGVGVRDTDVTANPPAATTASGKAGKAAPPTRVSTVALLPPILVDESKGDVAGAILAQPPRTGPAGNPNLTPAEVKGMSKKISWLLRHGALEEGLPLTQNGFVAVDALLAHRNLGRRVSIQMLAELVANSDKQRFALVYGSDGVLYIRANQGHSIEGLDVDMRRVKDPAEIPIAVHGTYYEAWHIIKMEGLNKMTRNHIHFAKGLPGDSGVISGMRSSAQVLIYLNVPLALQDGVPLLLSANGVILSPGIKGVIAPKYFLKAVDAKTGEVIFP